MPRCLTVLVLALLLALPASAPAATTHGPCIVGTTTPKCTVWRGTVPYQADDGDTLDVRVDGTSGFTRVRIAGIQAMELTDYGVHRAGECHGVDAATRVDELLELGGRRVRLAALGADSRSRGRPVRSVAIKIGGRWIDVGDQLIGEGLALWLPFYTEWEWNRTYSQLSRVSAEVGVQGLWNAEACGAGPDEGIALQLWVSSNPDGADRDDLNGEYVTVRNLDPERTLDLSNWWVRDSGLRRYTFAPGTVVGPGGHITVHAGSGTDTPTDRYWSLRRPPFDNASNGPSAIGDGGYLFDPQGDLRASMIYPCRIDCRDHLAGDLRLKADPTGAESVTVTNTSGQAADLFGYRLLAGGHQYAFPEGTVIQPGDRFELDLQGDPAQDTPQHRHWGLPSHVLGDHNGRVTLQTFDVITVACDAWGSSSC